MTATDDSKPAIGAGDPASAPQEPPAQEPLFSLNNETASWLRQLAVVRFFERKPRSAAAISLAVSGPVLAILTFFAIVSRETLGDGWLQTLIILDIIFLILAIALIAGQIARLVSSRRSRSAGSKLHSRMVAMFAGVAAAPAIILTLFFVLVVQLNFDAWFSGRVNALVRNSERVAQAYAEEHQASVVKEASALANTLSIYAAQANVEPSDARFAKVLYDVTVEAPLYDVFVITRLGKIIGRGANSYEFSYRSPTERMWETVSRGGIGVDGDRVVRDIRALARLNNMLDAYLYMARPLDPEVLTALERTSSGARDYRVAEERRGVWTSRFAVVFFGFVFLILLAAIYLGLWFAERLSRPIGRLAHAAELVRSGDLAARVKETRGDDELSLLSKAFNRMTSEVQNKQEALAIANAASEERRLFSEAVLGGVSAGVVALDGSGAVGLMNETASSLLLLDAEAARGARFVDLAPEFEQLFDEAVSRVADGAVGGAMVEKPVRIVRDNVERELLARLTWRGGDAAKGGRGYVLTLDDLTDLVQAQRLAAWGDVARRIAHEIKNPLTPIQLAAERLKRKYASQLGEDQEVFERYTDTIVRQTGDIGRMVDAFVRFAKMPSPKMQREDLADIVRESVLLQKEARSHINYSLAIEPSEAAYGVRADRGQLTQAFTNLLQNAADALGARLEQDQAEGRDGPGAQIRVRLCSRTRSNGAPGWRVLIEDNGVGLPKEDRSRLLEPYVTTREKGTGLGLAIVSKIVEEHAGKISLGDAEAFDESGVIGAAAAIDLPQISAQNADSGGEAGLIVSGAT